MRFGRILHNPFHGSGHRDRPTPRGPVGSGDTARLPRPPGAAIASFPPNGGCAEARAAISSGYSHEDRMLDQGEDIATAIGITVPHWLLSAINGAAALILMLVI